MTRAPGDKHSVAVTVYYPAGDIYNVRHTPYVDPLVAEAVNKAAGPAGASSSRLFSKLTTHAYDDAPAIGEGTFPVVLFWPGDLNPAAFHSTFLENLASHGYVAVGFTEPYNASSADVDLIKAPNASNDARMDSWAADAAFILQKLAGFNNSELGGVVDVNVVAVGGHSSGGEAAARAAVGHPNVKALLSMDAAPASGRRSPVPSLLMSSDDRRQRFTHHFQVRGIIHNDFATDIALLTEKYPREISTGRGSVRPVRVLNLVNTYSLAFLDRYLKGVQSSLLGGNSRRYPEMRYLS